MAKKQILKHEIHKYYRRRVGDKKRIVYSCAVPGCTHYLEPDMVIGKMSICWNCRQPFVVPEKKQLINAKPWCDDCRATRRKVKVPVAVEKLLDEILK